MKTSLRETRNNYMVNETDIGGDESSPENHEAGRNVSPIGKPAVMYQHFSSIKFFIN